MIQLPGVRWRLLEEENGTSPDCILVVVVVVVVFVVVVVAVFDDFSTESVCPPTGN